MLQLDLLCVCGVKKLAAWQRHSVTVAIVSQERTNSTFSQTTWAILTYAIHSLIQCTASQTHIISIKFTTSLYSKIQAGIETEKHPIPSCSLETILPIGIRHSSLNPKKKNCRCVYIFIYVQTSSSNSIPCNTRSTPGPHNYKDEYCQLILNKEGTKDRCMSGNVRNGSTNQSVTPPPPRMLTSGSASMVLFVV